MSMNLMSFNIEEAVVQLVLKWNPLFLDSFNWLAKTYVAGWSWLLVKTTYSELRGVLCLNVIFWSGRLEIFGENWPKSSIL